MTYSDAPFRASLNLLTTHTGSVRGGLDHRSESEPRSISLLMNCASRTPATSLPRLPQWVSLGT